MLPHTHFPFWAVRDSTRFRSSMTTETNGDDQRAYFVVNGLAQPLKLKLAVKSSLKNLFAHVPYSHADVAPEFYWHELKLDPNCCPVDYGMLPGPNHIHQLEVRMPPPPQRTTSTASDAATARVYQSMHPLALLGAMTNTPAPFAVTRNSSTSPTKQSSGSQAPFAATAAATERLIDELQYAVKVHSESAIRLNEQLVASRKELVEVTDIMTRENKKLSERVHELEDQVRLKEQLRQEQSQQSMTTIHQHFSAFEVERESRREEVDSLRKLISALTLEKDIVAQRNEELSRTLHQRDEEWAADLEHFTQQMKRAQQNTLQLEGKIAELSAVQTANNKLQAENKHLSEIAEREPRILDEVDRLRSQADTLQAHLMAANGTVIQLQATLATREKEIAEEKERAAQQRSDLTHKISALTAELSTQGQLLQEHIQRNASRPSEAQLHSKIRDVVAQNQRLLQLIKQPSSAITNSSVSPSLPPGIGRHHSPIREGSIEMMQSHWNDSVSRMSQERTAAPQSAMERMYPPAAAIAEPGSDMRPNVPRRSMRPVAQEEPVIVTRQELRRESVRQWADEALEQPELARRVSSVRPQPLQMDDAQVLRNVASMRQAEATVQRQQSVRQQTADSPVAGPQRMGRNSASVAELADFAPSAPVRTISRSRSVGELRVTSPSGTFLPPAPRGSISRTTDEHGRPLVPRRASLSISPSNASRNDESPDTQRKASIRHIEPTTIGGEEPLRRSPTNAQLQQQASMSRGGPQSMRLQSTEAAPLMEAAKSAHDLRQSRSAGDMSRRSSRMDAVDYDAQESRSGAPPTSETYAAALPRGTGGDEAVARETAYPMEEEVVVQFEDTPVWGGGAEAPPPAVDTTGLPGQILVVDEHQRIVIEEGGTDSLIVENASTSEPSTKSPPSSRSKGPISRPKPLPEIEQTSIPFENARNKFAHSAPLSGPQHPYVPYAAGPRSKPVTRPSPPQDNLAEPHPPPAIPQLHFAPPAADASNPAELSEAHAADNANRAAPIVVPITPRQRSPVSPGVNRATTPIGHSPRIAAVLMPTPRGPNLVGEPSGPIAPEHIPTPRGPMSRPVRHQGVNLLHDPSGPMDPELIESPRAPLESKAINYDATGAASEHFGTLASLFDAATANGGARSALMFHSSPGDTAPTSISWKKYGKATRQFAKAVVGEQYSVGTRVAIVGDNCAEWALSFMGSVIAGCVPVGIHAAHSTRTILQQLQDVDARLLIVDSPKTLKRLLLSKAQMPGVRRVVVCHGLIPPRVKEMHTNFVFSFEEFLERGASVSPEMLAEREASQAPEQCACIAFTSGTTQQPKPVMLSHDNLIFSAWAFANAVRLTHLAEADGNIRQVSHMSLGDVTYQVLDIVLPVVAQSKLGLNVVTYFSTTVSEDVIGLMQHAKPTIFVASPVAWKTIFSKAEQAQVEDPHTARYLGLDETKLTLWGGSSWNHGACLSTGDRKSLALLEFYSSTETSGIALVATHDRTNFASCGPSLPGTEVIFAPQPGAEAGDRGEMLIRGRHVAIGYYKLPTLSQQMFHDDGFFASGDIAETDENGLFYFQGRLSDFITNSNGEVVSLRIIEDGIQIGCSALSRVVAFGANRKNNICLLSIRTHYDAETGKYTEEIDDVAAAINPSVRTVAEARQDSVFTTAIGKSIQGFNNGPSCVTPAHKVTRFGFLLSEPVYDGDEVTVNGKLKRFVIAEKYSLVIEKLYENSQSRALLKRQASQGQMESPNQ